MIWCAPKRVISLFNIFTWFSRAWRLTQKAFPVLKVAFPVLSGRNFGCHVRNVSVPNIWLGFLEFSEPLQAHVDGLRGTTKYIENAQVLGVFLRLHLWLVVVFFYLFYFLTSYKLARNNDKQ